MGSALDILISCLVNFSAINFDEILMMLMTNNYELFALR